MEERAPRRSSAQRHLRVVPDEVTGLGRFAFLAQDANPTEFLRSVSGLIAYVHDCAEQGSVPMRDFIRSLGANASAGALAALAAIETMSPELDDQFEAGTQLAHLKQVDGQADLVDQIRSMLDNAQAVDAGEISQDHGDTSLQLLELDIEGAPLTAILTVDHNANHAVGDFRVVPETIRAFWRQVAAEPCAGTFEQQRPDIVAARFRHVLERFDHREAQTLSPLWQRKLRSLFWWVASVSDAGQPSGYDLRYWSPELQGRLVDHFRDSDIGKAACTPATEPHLETLSHIATMRGHGHPEQWGPRRIELCLLDWFPFHFDGQAPAHEFVGLLRAWIEWCSTLKVNAGRDFAQVFGALDHMEPLFLDLAELLDEAVERGDLDEVKRRRMGLDRIRSDHERPWQASPDVAAAVGRDFVTQIKQGPLVDADFDWTGLSDVGWVATFDTVRSIEGCCAALLTPEYAAAAKRLIRKIAWQHPGAFGSRSTVEQDAMAIVWIICSANAMFARAAERPDGEPRVRVKDLAAYFSLSPNAHRSSATRLLDRLGIERVGTRAVGLADPELLVAGRREHLQIGLDIRL